MITYNNRYRGPHEYDKFILNILSLHNMLEVLETYEVRGATEEITTLHSIHDDVKKVFELFTKRNGISEKSFLLAIKERECIKI